MNRIPSLILAAALAPGIPCQQYSIRDSAASVSSTGFAAVDTFGSGCGEYLRSSVEWFYAGFHPFDLQPGFRWCATPMGPGYAVSVGSSAYVPPVAAPLALVDGLVQQVSLPWSIPHPYGATQSIWVDFTGSIALEPIGAAGGRYVWDGAVTVFPLWAAFSAQAGSVYAEVDPSNGDLFHVTWSDVLRGANHRNTFQVTIDRNGTIEVKYEALDGIADAIVGVTPGHGALQWPIDLSEVSTRGRVPGIDTRDLELVPATPDARPVMGSTFGLTTNSLPAMVNAGLVNLSFQRLDPAIDLTSIGIDDCRLYTGVPLGSLQVTLPSVIQLSIPRSASFAGRTVYAQLVVTGFPAPTGLPIATSNGVAMTIYPN